VVSDTAYSVEFGDEISEQLQYRVVALTRLLDEAPIPALIEVIPSYRSVMIEYNPLIMDAKSMAELLMNLSRHQPRQTFKSGRTVEIPVCYGGAFGPDLADVATQTCLSEEGVVKIHSSSSYPVYMMGFMPGFPFLGGMDKRIAAPRLSTPRLIIHPGSVGIAGEQTGIYPCATPGGWRIIGRTPLSIFDKSKQDPFLLAVGDTVHFLPIDEATYLAMSSGDGAQR